MGSIQVPATPSRVVVDWDIGHVLALGVTPLGAPYSLIGGKKWLEPYINAEAVNIGNHNHISLEKVLALEPDLIITWAPAHTPRMPALRQKLLFIKAERTRQ